MTTLYGEYGSGHGYGSGTTISTAAVSAGAGNPPNNANFTSLCNNVTCTITSDSIDYYGLGVTQKVDSAAMTLYLGWRHFDPKVSTSTNGAIPLSSFDTVIGGARILF
ncbi:MAG: hypothetical protein EKK41_20095 [Hyphomicrobiales bacterium]|nr:MAG: hypothetical protein EKK41_20095 [Hyphomicrobiales bacterium]